MRADALPPEVERELAAIDDALAGRPVGDEFADLALLARDLREERPDIDPFFARDLDARAEAGFARSARDGRFGRLRRLRPAPSAIPAVAASMLVAVVVAAALLGPLAGDEEAPRFGADAEAPTSSAPAPATEDTDGNAGGGAGGSAGAVDSGAEAEPSGRDSASPMGSAPEPSVAVPPLPAPPGADRADRRRRRKVETSASMTLTAKPGEVDRVADGVVRTADRLGGYVVSSSVSSTDAGGSGTFELRVPSSRLQRALAELSRLAHVSDRQQATQDITAEHVSARERLENARAERKSLLRRLERAQTDAEVSALRARLADVSFRIRHAKADAARVNNRAAFSTITVALTSDPDAAAAGEDGRWGPGDAARDAVRVLEVAAGATLVGAAVLLPLAVLALIATLVLRAATRRSRERALDAV